MPSVTFHPVCPPSNKRKDGTWPVKIRVTFKGRHRYLATTLVARPGDLSRSLAIKSPDITRRAAELIGRMQDTLRDLSPFDIEAMDVDGIVAHIRGKMLAQSFRLDLFDFADTLLTGKLPQTRRVYDSALNALHAIPGDKDGCTHKVNIALRKWAERNGVQPFTFYAARKTWASLARRAGVEKATIDECLCHIGDFPVADIYIERDWELLNAANRRAIALLRW